MIHVFDCVFIYYVSTIANKRIWTRIGIFYAPFYLFTFSAIHFYTIISFSYNNLKFNFASLKQLSRHECSINVHTENNSPRNCKSLTRAKHVDTLDEISIEQSGKRSARSRSRFRKRVSSVSSTKHLSQVSTLHVTER